jgi:hypothetical protein
MIVGWKLDDFSEFYFRIKGQLGAIFFLIRQEMSLLIEMIKSIWIGHRRTH